MTDRTRKTTSLDFSITGIGFLKDIQQMLMDCLAVNFEQVAFEYLAVKAGLGFPAEQQISSEPV